MPWRLLACVGLVAVSAAVAARAQAPAAQFASGVDAVLVDVLVTRGGEPVTGLPASAFTVRDNGVAQQARLVDLASLPVGLLFVLDTSGSVSGEPLGHLKAAARAAVGQLRRDDLAAVLTFSQGVSLASDWTSDRAALGAAVDAVTARGATALSDAIFASLALRRPAGLRTLVLVFTDGEDTASWLSPEQITAAARGSDGVVYAATVDAGGAAKRLAALAAETGGEAVEAADTRALERVFAGAVARFNQRYVLAYTPTGVPASGWHALDVTVAGDDLTVTARRGYRR